MIGELSDIQHLASDPALAPFLKDGVPVIIWSIDGKRVVWASRAGAPLLDALAPEGVVASKEFSQNLAILALEPSQKHLGNFSTSIRLQRVRLPQMGTGNTGDVLTCACHVLTLPNGEHGLLTAVIGRLPERLLQNVYEPAQAIQNYKSEHLDLNNATDDQPAQHPVDEPSKLDEEKASGEEHEAGAHYVTASDSEHIKNMLKERAQTRPRRRFVWETDANGRFTVLSDDLTEAIGIVPETCIGKNWFELIGDKFKDPNGDVANALSQTRTWSVRGVPWRVEGTDVFVNVDMSAVPLSETDGDFSGFRGFGICHLDSAFANQMLKDVQNKIDNEEIKYARDYIAPQYNSSHINNDQWSQEINKQEHKSVQSTVRAELPDHMWVMWSEDSQGCYHTQRALSPDQHYEPVMRLEQGGHFFHPFLTTMSPTSRQMALGQSDDGHFSYASTLKHNEPQAQPEIDEGHPEEMKSEVMRPEETDLTSDVRHAATFAPQGEASSPQFSPSFSPQTVQVSSTPEHTPPPSPELPDVSTPQDADNGDAINSARDDDQIAAPEISHNQTHTQATLKREFPTGYATFQPVKTPEQAAPFSQVEPASHAVDTPTPQHVEVEQQTSHAHQEHENVGQTDIRMIERENLRAYAGAVAGKFMEEVVVSVDFEDQAHDFAVLDEFIGANRFPEHEEEKLTQPSEHILAEATSEAVTHVMPVEPAMTHFGFNPQPPTPTHFEPATADHHRISEDKSITESFEKTSENLKRAQTDVEREGAASEPTIDHHAPPLEDAPIDIDPDRALLEFQEEKALAQKILGRDAHKNSIRIPTFASPTPAVSTPCAPSAEAVSTSTHHTSVDLNARSIQTEPELVASTPRTVKAQRSTSKLNQSEREAFREIARLLKKNQTQPKDEFPKEMLSHNEPLSNDPPSGERIDRAALEYDKTITPQHIADHMMRDLSAIVEEASAVELEKSVGDNQDNHDDNANLADNVTPLPPSASNRLPRPKMVSDYDPGFAAILNRLPMGVVVLRGDDCLYANQTFLELVGYNSIHAINALGGLDHLFTGRPADDFDPEEAAGSKPLEVISAHGERIALDAALSSIYWQGKRATLLSFRRLRPVLHDLARLKALELDYKQETLRVQELSAILDTATDGVIVLDEKSRVLSMNRSAEALFGYDQKEIVGEIYTALLAGESHALALDYMEGLINHGVASLLNDGREVIGRVRQGGHIPLFITIGSLNHETTSTGDRRFCAVMRDLTTWKKAEKELIDAKQHAEETSAHKSDFLAKISHEIRTPLNAILGFTEVMRDGRFGTIENERYREYIGDIHTSGQHVISLVNDLLDLAKIEAGKADLKFEATDVNAMLEMAVAILHPLAVQEHVVVRMSLAPKIPMIVADERSLKQIAINLLSNAIKFTPEGGQVIVSSELTEQGEVVMRFRDTGIGMNGTDIKAALEPFRQVATSRRSGGTGLGLPLTKALTEANRGAFSLTSEKGHGTLVEITFPMTRVLAS